jgi:hypothetical protein
LPVPRGSLNRGVSVHLSHCCQLLEVEPNIYFEHCSHSFGTQTPTTPVSRPISSPAWRKSLCADCCHSLPIATSSCRTIPLAVRASPGFVGTPAASKHAPAVSRHVSQGTVAAVLHEALQEGPNSRPYRPAEHMADSGATLSSEHTTVHGNILPPQAVNPMPIMA